MAAGLGAAGAAAAPETAGGSSVAVAGAVYGVVSASGQLVAGAGEIYYAVSGDSDRGEQIEEAGQAVSAPLIGLPTLALTNGNFEAAATYSQVESWMTMGAGAVGSETATELLVNTTDVGLSLLGLGQWGCH